MHFPRLPSLKSFTIHCRSRWTRWGAAESGPQHAFLKSLEDQEVNRTHGVCRLMQIMKQEHDVSWELDIVLEEAVWSPITGKVVVRLKRVRAFVKTEEALVDGRKTERWVTERVSDKK